MNPSHPIDHCEKSAPRAGKVRQQGKLQQVYSWQIIDHVCGCCFGRLLVRETFDRRKVYRCTNCGLEREGKSETVLCACGLKLKTGVDMGVRCQRVDAPTPEFPSEVTAVAVDEKHL